MSRSAKKSKLAGLIRTRKLEDIPPELIALEEGKTDDEHFTKLYTQYSLGKLPAVLTRVDIEAIRPGVFKRSSDGSVGQFDFEAEPKFVEWLSYEIRCGFRPLLYLYRGIFGESVGSFVCADDVAEYYAYRNLGIRRVPAIVFGKNAGILQESGICVRIKNGRVAFDSAIAIPHSEWQTYLGSHEELSKLDPIEAVAKLAGTLRHAAARIKAFHIEQEPSPTIHYHHCLHSIALRLLEVLSAVEILLKNDMAYQIRPLVRSAYDLFLTFYMDWISPEHVGLLLQGLAALSRSEKNSPGYQRLKRSIESAYGGLANICSNMYEKGRLSPLGPDTHWRIYGDLSPAVHQDFGAAHEYADSLLSGSIAKMSREETMANLRWLDITTTATVTRLLDDVGASDGTLREWPELEVSQIRHVGLSRPLTPT